MCVEKFEIHLLVETAIANLAAELAVLLVQMYFIRDVLKDIVKETNYLSLVIVLALASLASLLSVKLFYGDFYILVTSATLFFSV